MNAHNFGVANEKHEQKASRFVMEIYFAVDMPIGWAKTKEKLLIGQSHGSQLETGDAKQSINIIKSKYLSHWTIVANASENETERFNGKYLNIYIELFA